MNNKLSEAIGVMKDYRKGDFVDDDKFCEAIDTVVEHCETKTYTAKDMETFSVWAYNNGWYYGELTEAWYNSEQLDDTRHTIEEVIKLWEGTE